MIRWLLALGAAACGSSPAPSPAVIPIVPRATAKLPPACVTPPEDVAQVRAASAMGSRLSYCIGPLGDQCFALDLASGDFEHIVEPPKPEPDPGARVAVTNPDVSVCTGDACKSITVQVLPSAARLQAATTSDGAFAVVLLGDAERGRGYAEVWDVAKKRRTASFPYARGDFRCGEVAMLGSTIYVSAATCGRPSARGSLYSLRGRRLGTVGGRDFGSFGGAYVHVTGATWAFLDENGARVVVEDVARGKVLKTFDTSALWAPAALGNPGESALVRLPEGNLAIVAGTPANGSVAALDLVSGAIKMTKAPICPPPQVDPQ